MFLDLGLDQDIAVTDCSCDLVRTFRSVNYVNWIVRQTFVWVWGLPLSGAGAVLQVLPALG